MRSRLREPIVMNVARDRTYSKKFGLDKNYRHTREIVEIASSFSNAEDSDRDENTIATPLVKVENCICSTEFSPVLFESQNLTSECDRVAEVVKNLLSGSWFGQSITPAAPEDIGISYPFGAGSYYSFIKLR